MHHTIVAILTLLSLAALVAIAVRRVKIPYSTALLMCGLAAGGWGMVEGISLDPEVVFFLFLPTLLFQAAITTDVGPLGQMGWTVGYLVIVGVPVTVLSAGAMAHGILGLPWAVAFLFAALSAPTDTVAVLSILREMRIPPRLAALIEGESLFVDGMALLVFNTSLALVLENAAGPGATALVTQFVWRAVGGAALGAVLGFGTVLAMKRIHDHLVEVLLTSILAYASYLGGEFLGVSSSLAVVAAGLVVGNYGLKGAISPTTQLTLAGFWSYSAFVVNSLLFLICGMEVPLARLYEWKGTIVLAYLLLLTSRALAVAPARWVSRGAGEAELPRTWAAVLVWSNFYGSLSMALALSLPHSVPARATILTVTFGVVLLSLVIQGVSMRWVIQYLKLAEAPEWQVEYDKCHGRIVAARGVQEELKRLFGLGLISRDVHDHLRSRYQVKASRTERQVKELYEAHRELEDRQYRSVEVQMLKLERSLVVNGMRDRLLAEEAGHQLLAEIDEALARVEG